MASEFPACSQAKLFCGVTVASVVSQAGKPEFAPKHSVESGEFSEHVFNLKFGFSATKLSITIRNS